MSRMKLKDSSAGVVYSLSWHPQRGMLQPEQRQTLSRDSGPRGYTSSCCSSFLWEWSLFLDEGPQ